MVLTTIFIIRHGCRSNWTTDPLSGAITAHVRSPTGLPADPALSAQGVVQARETAALAGVLDPPISRIYSSPYYRCLQTISPLWSALPRTPLLADISLSEWYGRAPFTHPRPAAFAQLATLFPGLTESATTVVPPPRGESLDALHDRCAAALAAIIAHVDAAAHQDATDDRAGSRGAADADRATGSSEESIVVCSHAAPIIAMGRALTGWMPVDATTADLDTWTCGVSRFERRRGVARSGPGVGASEPSVPMEEPRHPVDWRGGRGVGGGWTCTENASVAHLSGGGERNWHFSGDESFPDADSEPPTVENNGGTASKL